ncbi:MAG: glycosyltransferase [Bacteroidales bacterium]
MNKINNILICPLEWGLGHAGRMIALARRLNDRGNRIFVGAGREHQALFRSELPGLSYIDFPGFRPAYSRYLPQYLYLFLQIPVLLFRIVSEHIALKSIIRDNRIDIVISDNRFGLWNKKIKTVYVTHQPLIPFPVRLKFLEFAGIMLHRQAIKRYSLCFIPDLPGELNVSGRLSHGVRLPPNVRFIGILSRFTGSPFAEAAIRPDHPHNTIILSGPEPQKGILRARLVSLLKDRKPQTVILEGRPGDPCNHAETGNILSISHLPSAQMNRIISGSDMIIARSGYTSVMELISLNCSALLVPTPGQTEQEYLARYLSEKGWFCTLPQNGLEIPFMPQMKLIPAAEIIERSNNLIEKALDELLEQHERED